MTGVKTPVIEHLHHPACILRFPASLGGLRDARQDQDMANTKSAKKAVRQIVTRTERNKTRRSRMRSSVRKVEEAIATGDKAAAQAVLREAEPAIVRTAQKGIVHRKTASRKVARLTKRIRAMGRT